MMRRYLTVLLLIACIAIGAWFLLRKPAVPVPASVPPPHVESQVAPQPPPNPTAAESILTGYCDSTTPPIEDLRKIHRVVTGYFSLVKDSSRYPIGGNADLAAALRGENPNREVYVREGHPVFSADGLLKDRWGSPLVIHPEAWKQLEIRSAGPDKRAYTADDLILTPAGIQPQGKE